MLPSTNRTFDGVVYHVERVIEECLAIKPAPVFLWDEARFAFARFGPTCRQRTAMNAARTLRRRRRGAAAAEAWERQQKKLAGTGDAILIATRRLPLVAREGLEARPSYRDGLRAMRAHMPEIG